MKLFSQMRRFGNVLVLVLLSSCGGDDTGGGSDPGAGCTGGGCQTALTPVLSPTPSTFSTTTSVTLTDSTPGAVIHYTTDGSIPTGTSPAYSTPLSVATTTTIKAIAQAQGYLDSAVATGTYTISPVATNAATPTISPTPGTFSATTSVSLTDSTPGAVIHYTTDGSTPTGTSPTYSTPFSVATTSTIKAIAQAPGYLDSTVATGTYTITGGGGSCSTYSTIHLVGNQIHDTSGTQVVLRGPEAVVASTGDTDLIDQAASWGANGMRMLLTLDEANGMTPAGFDTLIGQAVSHNMIVWVSLYTWDGDHDHLISSALGGGNFYSLTAPDGTGTCSASTPAPCYLAVWSRQWLKDLIAKYQGHIIIDAMQEYIGTADRSTEAGRTEWANVAKVNIAWFRGAGYVEPLEIMSNFEGRDLYAIIEKGAEIRAADTLFVGSDPQTMFGWQAYWGVDAPDSWYYGWQGDLLLGSGNSITGMQAIQQFASQQDFPIQIGIDNYPGDTDHEYLDEMTQCATDNMSWLWWSSNGSSVECPADGDTCVNNVINSSVGFPGAVPSACGP